MAIDRILCVDDESLWREIFQEYFQRELTPNVDVAMDYTSAIKKIQENKYDLIILDGLSGDCFEITRNVQGVPHGDIIIFSAGYEIREEAERLGIPAYSKVRYDENLGKIVARYKPTA